MTAYRKSSCPLIVRARQERLVEDDLELGLAEVEEIEDMEDFCVTLMRCRASEQLFVYCFRQYAADDQPDDGWDLWIPVEADEVDELKQADALLRFVGDWVARRDLIARTPEGVILWVEGGHPPAAQVFIP